MAWRDATAGLMMVVLSLVLFIGTWEFTDVGGYVSPKIFPRIVATILFGFSSVLVVQSIATIRHGRAGGQPWLPGGVDWANLRRRYSPFVILVAVSWGYIILIPIFGYLAATLGFVAATAVLFGERRRPVVAMVAIAASGLLYALFRYVFLVPLPRFDLF